MESSRRLLWLVALLAVACSPNETARLGGAEADRRPLPRTESPERSSVPRIVVLGDSLTAGLGLDRDEAFPAVLARRLREAGYRCEVVNAGVSGDTSAGGVRRLEWALDGDVRVLVLALGANDGLRGLPVAEMKANLAAIIRRAKARGIAVLLAGMEAPPNLGPAYTAEFREAFRALAREEQVPLVRFLLEGVAGQAALNQPDGMHPNAEGARRIAEHLWPALEPLVASAAPRELVAAPQ